jgi:hypothetical protein
LEFSVKMVENINNGKFFTLTKQERLKQRDSMRNSVSISIDHSISDQDSQCKESLSAMEPTMSGSEDGERML